MILCSESSDEECVWRMLAQLPFGQLLERAAADNPVMFIHRYLHDYVRMVYTPASRDTEDEWNVSMV